MNIFDNIFEPIQMEKSDFFKSVVRNPIPFSSMSDINNYKKIEDLGEGTFGKVFKAFHKETKEIYAVKQMKHQKGRDQLTILTMREIKILNSLKHINIIELKDICYRHKYTAGGFTSDFYLIFEYCEQDLLKRIEDNKKILPRERNSIMTQCLNALDFMHANNYIHRDLKPENILLDKNGVVKFADFGWARSLMCSVNGKKPEYTPDIVTMWYRSPELLLHDKSYNESIDIWSLGCIFFELCTKYALFSGKNEIDQLRIITEYCGEITEDIWPEGYKLKLKCKKMQMKKCISLKEHLAINIRDSNVEHCILSMLPLNPSKRPSARQIMDKFF